MLNFISSDYSVLEPFQDSSVAVRTLRALYIIIITIIFLNILIAMLNLKIKRADRYAKNLYHLQMASLQVEIELGLLSSSERARRDWFPVWFNYSMTETEKRVWEDDVRKNPLKWTEENDFGEDKDHAPCEPAATSKVTAGEEDWEHKTEPPSGSGSGEQRQDGDQSLHGADGSKPAAASGSDDVIQDETAEQSSSSIDVACGVCGQPGKRCTSCMSIAYCGKQHQKQDWKNHKSVCKGKQTQNN